MESRVNFIDGAQFDSILENFIVNHFIVTSDEYI